MAAQIGLVLLVVVGAFALFAATRPTHFRIERSLQINAPSSAIFPLINDFHYWADWSPWEKLDSNLQKTFSGPTAGTGAEYAWVGNKKAGEGRMAITGTQPNERVTIRIQFIKPFAATNVITFTLTPSGAGTQVSWSLEGDNGFMAKAFSVFMNMDALVGKDFEAGLASLNERAQRAV